MSNRRPHTWQEPPTGWYPFGWHVDKPGALIFSEEVDDSGMPRFERPAVIATEEGAE